MDFKIYKDGKYDVLEYSDGVKEWWFNGINATPNAGSSKKEKQFEWFNSLDKAKKRMREYLKQEICSRAEEMK